MKEAKSYQMRGFRLSKENIDWLDSLKGRDDKWNTVFNKLRKQIYDKK